MNLSSFLDDRLLLVLPTNSRKFVLARTTTHVLHLYPHFFEVVGIGSDSICEKLASLVVFRPHFHSINHQLSVLLLRYPRSIQTEVSNWLHSWYCNDRSETLQIHYQAFLCTSSTSTQSVKAKDPFGMIYPHLNASSSGIHHNFWESTNSSPWSPPEISTPHTVCKASWTASWYRSLAVGTTDAHAAQRLAVVFPNFCRANQ
jgi:hypothetical protein